VAVGGIAALSSSTNAALHNPFGVLARQAMLGVSFLGRLRGPELSATWTLALAVALLALAGALHAGLKRSPRPRAYRLVARSLFTVSLVGLALYTALVPLRFSRTVSPIDEISRAVEVVVPEDRVLQVVLPKRKRNHPLFQFYLGGRPLHIRPGLELPLDELAGEFLLTDVATLKRSRRNSSEISLPARPIAQARGYLLFQLPPA
jgi:hypothetical protein